MKVIDNFSGEYFFLSNFYTAPVVFDGLEYKNNEAAFQSAKCINKKNRIVFTKLNPSDAKKLGRRVDLRADWEDIKDKVMYMVVLDKFIRNKDLGKKLIETGDSILIEGNWWKDYYWGVCNGKGLNKLGKILMKVRQDISKKI